MWADSSLMMNDLSSALGIREADVHLNMEMDIGNLSALEPPSGTNMWFDFT